LVINIIINNIARIIIGNIIANAENTFVKSEGE